MINITSLKNIDFTGKSLIIVDLSYYIYARFHGTRNWYNYANPGEDQDQDWLKNKLFMEKFSKLFFSKLNQITKTYNILDENILFAIDSSFKDNWRLKLNESYKETRPESHKKNNFSAWGIFDYVKKNLIYNKKYFKVNGLEADDIVAVLIKYLKKIDPTSKTTRKFKYYILGTDKDYIQICNDRTFLIDIHGNILNDKYLHNITNIKFLLEKILLGDKSDNIKPCFIKKNLFDGVINRKQDIIKCTPSVTKKLLEDKEIYNKLLKLLTACRKYIANNIFVDSKKIISDSANKCYEYEKKYIKDEQFIKNALLIDFAMIPKNYKRKYIIHDDE